MVLRTHPDKIGGDVNLFIKVMSAFETLADATKREAYNADLDRNCIADGSGWSSTIPGRRKDGVHGVISEPADGGAVCDVDQVSVGSSSTQVSLMTKEKQSEKIKALKMAVHFWYHAFAAEIDELVKSSQLSQQCAFKDYVSDKSDRIREHIRNQSALQKRTLARARAWIKKIPTSRVRFEASGNGCIAAISIANIRVASEWVHARDVLKLADYHIALLGLRNQMARNLAAQEEVLKESDVMDAVCQAPSIKLYFNLVVQRTTHGNKWQLRSPVMISLFQFNEMHKVVRQTNSKSTLQALFKKERTRTEEMALIHAKRCKLACEGSRERIFDAVLEVDVRRERELKALPGETTPALCSSSSDQQPTTPALCSSSPGHQPTTPALCINSHGQQLGVGFHVLEGTISLQGIAQRILNQRSQNIIVFLGAGASTASGAPDFRGLNGVLRKSEFDTLFTLDGFRKQPERFWRKTDEWFLSRQPTKCHTFLAKIAQKGCLRRVYTQNVDGLEQAAGVPEELIVDCHGSLLRQRCSVHLTHKVLAGRIAEQKPMSWRAPRCHCGALLRPDIVFYEEPPTLGSQWEQDLKACDLLIVIGTSLAVKPVNSIVDKVSRWTPRLLINNKAVGPWKDCHKDNYRDVFWEGTCDDGADTLMNLLGWS